MATIGKNIEATVKDGILTLRIDLKKTQGKSASGKSTIVATTAGNQEVEGADGLLLGLNAYRKEK